MQFTELRLDNDLLAGIDDAQFVDCMPVQERVFAESLKGRDVYVQSQTGSGKTAAFLITVFEQFRRGTFGRNRAVIIVPTRELAVQIESEAKLLGSHLGLTIGSFFGGVGYHEQFRLLEKNVEVVIGTPGRLIDLEQRKKINFKDTSILIIDEADRLFDMGFLPDIQKMIRRMPQRERRMTMLFSATLNTRVWQLAWEHMNDPVQIIMNPENITVREVHQELYHVSTNEKLRLLLGVLDQEKPENALIFTNTKNEAAALSQRLSYNGYHSEFIIGDLPQNKRLRLIERMKSGDLQILVATDVAARGLHINELPVVVNYDIPQDPEGYVHRIGRTARAGKSGKAISLACERYVYGLESIETLIEMKIPVLRHDESMLAADKSRGQRIDLRAGRLDRSPEPRRDERGRGTAHRAPRREPVRAAREGSTSRTAVGSRNGRAASQQGGRRQPAAAASGRSAPARRDETTRGGRQERVDRKPTRESIEPAEKYATRGGSKRPARGQNEHPRGLRAGSDGGRSGAVRKDRDQTSRTNSRITQKSASPPSGASEAERIEYYRSKYGEDFKFVDHREESNAKGAADPEVAPRSLLKRLFGRRRK